MPDSIQPDINQDISEEKAKQFNWIFHNPLLVFHYKNESRIQDTNGNLLSKSNWKLIKHQIDLWYKKNKFTDKRIQEINEQGIRELERRMNKINFSQEKREVKPKKGSIYILQLKNQQIYKIGISLNLQNRLKNIQNSIPLECVLLHIILSNDILSNERKLHDLFKDKKINIPGFKNQEWFKLNKRDIRYLMGL